MSKPLTELIGADVVDVAEGCVTEGLIVEKNGTKYRVRAEELEVDAVSLVDKEDDEGENDGD